MMYEAIESPINGRRTLLTTSQRKGRIDVRIKSGTIDKGQRAMRRAFTKM